ncbi:related to Heme oxygenase [Ustilago trichophora]|uniref:Related to Heme oxygenase n=1 Tax=Ustilago trichophora TaxID=86804 RepID=A0A5C3DT57_9BASI|nr:related to Heme oxygenase [Ustilago trichophora]
MTCPFAKFASILPIVPNTDHGKAFHSIHGSLSPSPKGSPKIALTLSEALRVGTARSHRLVEKSRGVSLLLQSLSSSSSHQAELTFDRVDYIRFNIMLACVYVALEASMYNARSDALLEPLFGDSDLMQRLARSGTLLEDVEAHLEMVKLHTGASLADLAEEARERHLFSASSSTTLVPADVEDPVARKKLFELVQASLPIALRLDPSNTTTNRTLTEDHIALLHPAQIDSTLTYVLLLLQRQNPSPSPSTPKPGLLLSHAYTRYLGDLSGGQHIVRKVSKRFPTESVITSSTGFAFYAFHGQDLKVRFRNAMEAGFANATCSTSSERKEAIIMDELVQEANQAFLLNTGLFESLLPVEFRMSPEQGEQEQVAVLGGKVAGVKARSAMLKSLVMALLFIGLTIWFSRDLIVSTQFD